MLGKIPIDAFAGEAAAAARWTQTVLDERARAFLDALAPQADAPGAELFHGSPRDPVWDYVLSDGVAAIAFALTEAPLVLVGHSHVALEFSVGHELRGEPGASRDAARAGRAAAAAQPRLGRPAAGRRPARGVARD